MLCAHSCRKSSCILNEFAQSCEKGSCIINMGLSGSSPGRCFGSSTGTCFGSDLTSYDLLIIAYDNAAYQSPSTLGDVGGGGGLQVFGRPEMKKLRNQSFSLFPSNGISTCFFLLTNESVSLHRGLHLAICELIVINIITRHLRHTQPDVQWSPHTDAVECPLCSSCWDILRFFTDD